MNDRQSIQTMFNRHNHSRYPVGGRGGGRIPFETMTDKDYKLTRLRMQAQVLNDLMAEYHGRTIDNILTNLKVRIEYYENH